MMQGTAQAEITPQTAVHRAKCDYCGVLLTGKQARFCSESHKNAYHSAKRSGTLPNPLEAGQPFSLSLANPNPKFRPRKDGDHWFIEFELSAEEAAYFLDPNINRKGMVIEAIHCEVAHMNTQPKEKEPEPEQPKGGKLSEWAGIKCREPEFWRFLQALGFDAANEEEARSVVCSRCGIDTRAKLDHDAAAARRFNELFRLPFQYWTDKQRRQA